MKMRYEYINMVEVAPPRRGRKTKIWGVRNNRSGEALGMVQWHAPWRQYCYFPTQSAVYSAGCLADIQAFIEEASDG